MKLIYKILLFIAAVLFICAMSVPYFYGNRTFMKSDGTDSMIIDYNQSTAKSIPTTLWTQTQIHDSLLTHGGFTFNDPLAIHKADTSIWKGIVSTDYKRYRDSLLMRQQLTGKLSYSTDTGNTVSKFWKGWRVANYVSGLGYLATGSFGNDILQWNTTYNYFTPYATQTATGCFDKSGTAPVHTNRLNYDGYFWATKLYSNGSEVLTSYSETDPVSVHTADSNVTYWKPWKIKNYFSSLGYTAGANSGIAKMESNGSSTSIPAPTGGMTRWYPTNLSALTGTGITCVTAKGAFVTTVAGVYFSFFKVDVAGANSTGNIQVYKGGSAISIFGTWMSTATTTATCCGIGFVTMAVGDSLMLRTVGNGTAATGDSFQWLIFKFSN